MKDKIQGFNINSKGYGIIPKMVMIDQTLSIGTKALYSYFCSYAGAGDTCFPSRKKICYDLGISKDTFSKYVAQLVEHKYIKVEQIKENGRFSYNVYTLRDTILPCPKKTDTEKTGPGEIAPNNNSTNINSISNNNSISNIKKRNIKEKKVSSFEDTKSTDNNNKEAKEKQVRHKYGEYQNVLLSDTEYEKLINEFPNDYQERIERLSEYIASTGKKYKDFLATIRSWARRENKEMAKKRQAENTYTKMQRTKTSKSFIDLANENFGG